MKILLVQTGFLGDSILSTPVIRALHLVFPSAQIWMMCTPQARPLFEDNPLLSGIIVHEKRGAASGIRGLLAMAGRLRTAHFDRVYSLHKSFRTSLLLALARIPVRIGFAEATLSFLYHRRVKRPREVHEVERALSILDGECAVRSEELLELMLPPTDSSQLCPEVAEKLSTLLQSPSGFIAIVPGSVWPTKRWTPEGFTEVARRFITDDRLPVVILGAPDEAEIGKTVAQGSGALNLTGTTTVKELLIIISKARLLLCNDSMSLHVASAYKVPTVTIFCATSPTFGFGPWRNRAIVIEKEGLSCKPCARHGGYKCPAGTDACMRGVEAERVYRAAQTLLRSGF